MDFINGQENECQWNSKKIEIQYDSHTPKTKNKNNKV